MSAGTIPSSSSSSGTDTQSSTQPIDQSVYVYLLPEQDRINVCCYLDDVWEEVAKKMGYTRNDLNRIKSMARSKQIGPAEQLLSLWGDQNHTVTELFMVLYSLRQFPAMECLKDHVDKRYHRLLLEALPNFKSLLGILTGSQSKSILNMPSLKILNGPEMSRDTNESHSDFSMQSYSETINEEKIHEVAKAIPHISYNELKEATRNWHDDNKRGHGGFGIVYQGTWKHTDVAIKKLRRPKDDSSEDPKEVMENLKQSLNELRHLNSCRHDNILALYGYSLDNTDLVKDAQPCVVYQYMSGGSLDKRLHPQAGKAPLSFKQRQRIIKGTACGLQYLHTYIDGKPLIHGDIKPGNILLDACCTPKIGDFGLVREGWKSTEASKLYGTRPYLPKEFLLQRSLSTKIDTFSFGIVLYEVLTAMQAYDKNRDKDNKFLFEYMRSTYKNDANIMFKFVDKNLNAATVSPELFHKLITISLWCTEKNTDNRPEMVNVYNQLAPLIKIQNDEILQNE